MTRRIVVAGATGLIGSALVDRLKSRGDEVVRLVRTVEAPGDVRWDPARGDLTPETLDGVDAVVCLNGAGIGDKRWTPARKALLRSSRIEPTSLLAETMAAVTNPPKVFVAGSAIGYYGDTGDREVDEGSGPGDDFLAELCVDWEAAANPAREAGIRVAHPRTGIVLAASGGALAPLLPIFKAGLGGPIGSGNQWWSWIAIDDEVAALTYLIDNDVDGPVNLVSPYPVRQRAFATALGAQLHRPAVVPAPKLAVRVRLGRELAESLGYGSQRVVPRVLLEPGFSYSSPELTEALAAIFG